MLSELDLRIIRKELADTGRLCLQLTRIETDLVIAACPSDIKIGEAPLSYARGVHLLTFTPETAIRLMAAFKDYQKTGIVPAGINATSIALFKVTGGQLANKLKRLLDEKRGTP